MLDLAGTEAWEGGGEGGGRARDPPGAAPTWHTPRAVPHSRCPMGPILSPPLTSSSHLILPIPFRICESGDPCPFPLPPPYADYDAKEGEQQQQQQEGEGENAWQDSYEDDDETVDFHVLLQ